MTDESTLVFTRCETIEDAVQIRANYQQLKHNSSHIWVDMQNINRQRPDKLLVGVLLNMQRYFSSPQPIAIKNSPPYLAQLLQVCKIDQYFNLQ
jgi:anti-anti-sigma regulatory factor